MDFLKLMQERYTTKHYDASRKVSEEALQTILECARLTPTSVNSQPYHFYVAEGAAKDSLRPAVKDFNLQRYDGASHVILISAFTEVHDEHLQAVVAAEAADGRLPTAELQAAQDKSRRFFSQLHVDRGDYAAWTGKQAYVAFASIVYAAASLGVDSTALEGIDEDLADEILGLKAKGEHCQLMIVLGYRDKEDSNTTDRRPKSRLPAETLISRL